MNWNNAAATTEGGQEGTELNRLEDGGEAPPFETRQTPCRRLALSAPASTATLPTVGVTTT